MKALYISSLENFSGKTAVCLAIGKRLQTEGYKVGYLKPVGHQPTLMAGRVADEDAIFARNVLAIEQEAWELSPVVVTPQVLADCIGNGGELNLEQQVRDAYQNAAQGKDVLLLEGGGSLREGYAVGLATPYVAEMLDVMALAVVKFRGRMRMLDDALTAQLRLGDRLLGVILNRIPAEEHDFTAEQSIPFLEKRGIPVLGALPERPQLAAISVGELIETLDATVLTGEQHKDALVQTLMVGAMGAQEALSRFRVNPDKAVITGGDRVDIQLAALETSTVCLVLTGNLRPTAAIVERAAEQGVAVLVVPPNTMETVEAIDRVFGKTRLGQADKLARFEGLMAEHVDYKRLFELLGL